MKNIDQALTDLYVDVTNEDVGYELLSNDFITIQNAIDNDYCKNIIIKLKNIALQFTASSNTDVIAYGTFINNIITATTDSVTANDVVFKTAYKENPITIFSSINITSIGAFPGILPVASLYTITNTELNKFLTVFGKGFELLAQLMGEHYIINYNKQPTDYLSFIFFPALIEFCENSDLHNVYDFVDSYVESYIADVFNRPSTSYGKRPSYTVTEDDTLESVARQIYGKSNETDRLISELGLLPPYITSTVPTLLNDVSATTTLWSGFRISLAGDEAFLSVVELLGYTWALDVQPAPGHQEWDLALDGDEKIIELAGIDALGTELALKLTQPKGDWVDDDNENFNLNNYPVNSEFIGVSAPDASTAINFALAQAMLSDRRVKDARPINVANTYEGRVIVRNVVITPIDGKTE